jgi:hypothetical protein
MPDNSISNKLSELFELQKSGTISKEEFDKLKMRILSEAGLTNAEPERNQEIVNELLSNNSNQKKGSRIWLFALIGIACVVLIALVLKITMSSNSALNVYIIKGKAVNADVLPQPGLYIFNNGNGYQKFINVGINDGAMTFQTGESENGLENQEVLGVEESNGLITFNIGWEIKYIGDGVLKEYIYGATSEPGEGINYIKKLQPGE